MQETDKNMADFWECNFQDKQEMWGTEPAKSAHYSKDFFTLKGIKNILIPGIGYGRNAQVFIENGFDVTGIEISKTAIELARKRLDSRITLFLGSVNNMPFDSKEYNGIFCYALIHLLDTNDRKKLICNCYNQLPDDGYMVFTAITKEASNFGKGKRISKDRYELYKGAKIFYYDTKAVEEEFYDFGLCEIIEISESQPLYLIICKKVKK
ncbi:MAG: class I SAM-dependent methyltransferase [Aequorivita sp.]